ncbi:gluconolaconase [Undibacterium sp. CY18W]|uniref:Gluconolaconase n=1 Tax=Undibacterium hunanense TaxID=2762292 RepID=A0ABR6ZVR8_9BURK|nr:NHL repeat-containing protein [Undibacterium hunanense]MBC3919915.1 gluconolaconase [Undibacterium hunanense]
MFKTIVIRLLFVIAVLAILLGLVRYLGKDTGSIAPGNLLAKVDVIKKPAATSFDWQAELDVYAGVPDVDTSIFSDPYALAIDKQGNIFVSDAGEHNKILKISAEGTVTQYAGSVEGFVDGKAELAAFHTPSGIAFDGKGNLLVADTGNHAIRRISPDGIVTTLAGNGKPGYHDGAGAEAQFNGPVGIAVDAAGNVYVADTYNDRIRKIGPDGQVSTLAGGNGSGYLDGPAATALFDTPTGLAINSKGEIFIADSKNDAIRKLSTDGQVSTITRALEDEDKPVMHRPLSIVATYDDHLYVGEAGKGRIIQIAPTGEIRGVTGVGVNFEPGDETTPRLLQPTGIGLDDRGTLFVSDSARLQLLRIRPHGAANARADEKPATPAALQTIKNTRLDDDIKSYPWPVKPQNSPHEVVGTMGEVRGNYDGESRDHFHGGLDIQANMGTTVYAIASEKVRGPSSSWGFNGLSEGLKIDSMAYIHMKVGRTAKNDILDGDKFQLQTLADGKPYAVRVRRGTRFRTGEALGSINRMFHVHLEHNHAGLKINPLQLNFPGLVDTVAPQIEEIMIVDGSGNEVKQKQKGRLILSSQVKDYGIVVDAYDQVDGNATRRRLGLYQLGYQLLYTDGSPVPGYENPRMTMEFNALPPDREMVKLLYAEESGITVHGAKKTRFLYMASNTVKDGIARKGNWDVSKLAAGDYILRIHASDFAGNEASKNRDLAFSLE